MRKCNMKNKYKIIDTEIIDNCVREYSQVYETGLYNTLGVSVLVTVQNTKTKEIIPIDYKTTYINYSRPSTNLHSYAPGIGEKYIIAHIKKESKAQQKYDEYIKHNYKLIKDPISKMSPFGDFLAERINLT